MPESEQFEQLNDTLTDLHFQVDAALLFQLGEQLVARRSIALAELIKNSYDADATKVTVTFEGVTKPNGTIIIEDDGSGMTFEDIAQGWMRVAYSDKMKRNVSRRYCRPLTGAKGIGRFACRRLAKRLVLNTVAKRSDGTKERVVVHFDWEKFLSGQPLASIAIAYERIALDATTPTGVTLRLEQTTELWTIDDATKLQRDLLSLTSPFPEDKIETEFPTANCEKDPSFSITFVSSEFPAQSGDLSETFLERAWKLTGYVDEEGNSRYSLNIPGQVEPVLFSPPKSDKRLYNQLKSVRFVINFMVYKKDFLSEAITFREASEYGRKQGGVRLYLNNFRVFPYGDPKDDWLRLDEIRASRNTTLPKFLEDIAREVKRPLLSVPGNNQLFGAVHIPQSETSPFQQTVNRERLIENLAFEQLVEFVQTGIFWMTIVYARKNAEDKSRREDENTVANALTKLETAIAQDIGIEQGARSNLNDLLTQTRQVMKQEEAERMSEISLLRVLASAGTAFIVFTHQLRAMLDGLLRIYYNLQKLREQSPPNLRAEFDALSNELEKWRRTVEGQAIQIGILAGADSRTKQRSLVVYPVVDAVIASLSSYVDDLGIDVRNVIPRHFRTPPMFEAELHAIILNVFTNALKAVRGQEVRRVEFDATQDSMGLTLWVRDTGIGIEPNRREEVFRPFNTTSMPDPVLGVGTGIGLKVVQDLMKNYGGYARFIDAHSPWKTVLSLYFPKGN